jgi:hypothetical protein
MLEVHGERSKRGHFGMTVFRLHRPAGKSVIFSQMYDLVYEQMDQAGVEEIWKSRSGT